jgi:hypothetical protein
LYTVGFIPNNFGTAQSISFFLPTPTITYLGELKVDMDGVVVLPAGAVDTFRRPSEPGGWNGVGLNGFDLADILEDEEGEFGEASARRS